MMHSHGVCLMSLRRIVLLGAAVLAASFAPPLFAQIRLSRWDRGISVDSTTQEEMRAYLWFYEWHMFGAFERGQHTNGTWENRIHVTEAGQAATVVSRKYPGLSLEMNAVVDGAVLKMRVTNRSGRRWPELASIIACFNPGPQATRNRQLANTNSWFHAADGLTPLAIKAPREIHYNRSFRKAIDAQADRDGKFVWSSKWPASEVDAIDGLIIRESTDGQWVTGIAWSRFLSAQGHNPWECMHLSAHVGPLDEGKTRLVEGRIWLFRGDKDELLGRYKSWKASLSD